MRQIIISLFWAVLFFCAELFALSPDEVLVIVNSANEESVRTGVYYCQKRGVPADNLIKLDLKRPLFDTISRVDYEEFIAKPILEIIGEEKYSDKIKCLVTVYGIPFRIAKRGVLESQNKSLDILTSRLAEAKRGIVTAVGSIGGGETAWVKENSSLKEVLSKSKAVMENVFREVSSEGNQEQKKRYFDVYIKVYGKSSAVKKSSLCRGYSVSFSYADKLSMNSAERFFNRAEEQKWDAERKLQQGYYEKLEKHTGLRGVSLRLEADIAEIKGLETDAALDSELSMLKFLPYNLYRWQENELKESFLWFGVKTLMVSRLDGPGAGIAMSLVDKALEAESRGGLKGDVCIDWGYSRGKDGGLYVEYDRSLERTAELFRAKTGMEVRTESTSELFGAGSGFETAVYCGWYSLEHYVDAFDFVPGAVGYHIASFEAVNLRDPNSGQWCPSMLKDGAGACVGAVGEPYLSAFPRPDEFFAELLRGKSLAEAYYRTNPYNSWRMLLIGDPLYVPFGRDYK